MVIKFNKFILLVILLLLSSFKSLEAKFAHDENEIDKIIIESKNLVNQNKIPDAIKLLNDYSYKNYKIYDALAVIYEQNNQPDLAIKSYNESLKLEHNNIFALKNLGFVLLKANNYKQACQVFLKLAKSDYNKKYIAYYNIAYCYFQLNDNPLALKYIDLSINDFPHFDRAYLLQGEIYSKELNYQEAKNSYLNCLKINPDSIEAHNNLGVVYSKLSMDELSLKEFKTANSLQSNKAIEKNLGFAMAHNSLGNLYFKQNKFDQAKQEYLKALEIDPKQSQTYFNLGVLYQNQNDNDKAINAYNLAIKLKPDYYKAYNNLGVIYMQQKKTNQARDCFNKCLKFNHNYQDAITNIKLLQNNN